jgi:hypothetical protein
MDINLTAIPTTIDMFHVGLGVLAVLFFILFLVKQKPSTDDVSDQSSQKITDAEEKPAVQEPVKETAKAAQLKETNADAALQLLTLLQQDARFIDFVQEDLTGYSDADIGAAARVVHEGSKKTLNSYFKFAAVRDEEEESRITLPEGFNAAEVRLTGNVVGDAPFTGTLVHKGWKVTDVKLPKLAEGHDTSIVASAEVEL